MVGATWRIAVATRLHWVCMAPGDSIVAGYEANATLDTRCAKTAQVKNIANTFRPISLAHLP